MAIQHGQHMSKEVFSRVSHSRRAHNEFLVRVKKKEGD